MPLPDTLTGRDVIAVVLVLVVGGLTYTGSLDGSVASTLFLAIAGAYGLVTRRAEHKIRQQQR